MSDDTPAPSIPKPRFDAVLARAKDAEAALAALQAEHKTLAKDAKSWQRDAEIAAELRNERDALTAQLQDQRQTGDAHLAMVSAGVTDPEVRDYALHRYNQQQGTKEGKDWGDWWTGQQETPGAVLRPFLAPEVTPAPAAAPPAPAEAPQSAAAPSTPAAPQTNAGARPTPPAAQAYTPGSIASLPREARKAALAAAMSNGASGWPFN